MKKLFWIVLKGSILNEATAAYLLTQVDIRNRVDIQSISTSSVSS